MSRILVLSSVRWLNASAAYAVDVAAGLARRGHDVRVVVKPDGPVEAEARRRGLAVETGFDLTATEPGRVFAGLRGLRALVAAFRPELVNAHRSEDHLLAAMALRGSGVPLVRTRGDVRPPRSHLANRILYRRATALQIACADFMPDRFYAPLGIEPAEVAVIRPGLDVEAYRRDAPERGEARRELGLDEHADWIGLVGRFTAAKGHRSLIRAFARLPGAPRLLLSGTANEISAEALRAEAAAAGAGPRVTVAGRVDDVRAALRALDVLAVPSVASEAISRIALEALALGVPVVASRLNSLPEMVGDAGILVPPGDEPALAAALTRALADPGFRERAAEAGPARVTRRYDRRTQIDLTEARFGGLIRGGRG